MDPELAAHLQVTAWAAAYDRCPKCAGRLQSDWLSHGMVLVRCAGFAFVYQHQRSGTGGFERKAVTDGCGWQAEQALEVPPIAKDHLAAYREALSRELVAKRANALETKNSPLLAHKSCKPSSLLEAWNPKSAYFAETRQ